MKNQKRQILMTIKSLENVIESISHTLMSDELEDLNFFITKIKDDVKNIKHNKNGSDD